MLAKLINAGTDDEMDFQELRAIRLFNFIALTFGVMSISYASYFYQYVDQGWAIPILIFSIFSLLVPYLNMKGLRIFGLFIFLLFGNTSLLVFSWAVGFQFNTYIYYFLFVGLPFLLDGYDNWERLLLFIILPIFFASLLIFEIPPPFPALTIDEQVFKYLNRASQLFCLIEVSAIFFFLARENYSYVKKLGLVIMQKDQSIEIKEKIAQKLRLAKKEAEQAARARKEFLSTMSHEIRTPLNAIIGLSSLLEETELTQEQREFLETVRISGESLLLVINDILDFSKIESGKLEFEEKAFNVASPIEDVFDLLSKNAFDKGLELIYYVDRNVPKEIIGDNGRLRQVLINLVNNAVKFTAKGEVIIEVKQNQMYDNACELEFEVRDTGIGIPKDKMERLFKPFSQVDASTTRKYGGTGLGLIISKRIVELMGGNIWVKSEVNLGTSFFFTVKVKMDKEANSKGRTAVDQIPKKILLVDDHKINLKILEHLCKRWGFQVDATTDPTIGFHKLHTQHYDLGILDWNMPKLDGIGLAHKVRQYKRKEELPLILLGSLSVGLEPDEKMLFNSILNKPARRSHLRHTIHKELGLLNKPTKKVATHKPKLNQVAKPPDGPLSILVAEDHPANQKVIKQMLKRIGYEMDLAENGLEVLSMVKEKQYDLIFMDVQMPEMDGIEATRELKKAFKSNPENCPIIIALTANAMKVDMETSMKAGMDDYLMKPVKKRDIQQVITNYFSPSGTASSNRLKIQ